MCADAERHQSLTVLQHPGRKCSSVCRFCTLLHEGRGANGVYWVCRVFHNIGDSIPASAGVAVWGAEAAIYNPLSSFHHLQRFLLYPRATAVPHSDAGCSKPNICRISSPSSESRDVAPLPWLCCRGGVVLKRQGG